MESVAVFEDVYVAADGQRWVSSPGVDCMKGMICAGRGQCDGISCKFRRRNRLFNAVR